MKTRIRLAIGFFLWCVFGLALCAIGARAQQASSSGANADQTSPSGTVGRYDMVSSMEVGARAIVINGNADKYRSDLNYTPGFRLFDASLLLKSPENEGLFDKLLVNSNGWGGDPNRELRVNAERTGWYKLDANYRRLDYFNSLNNIALQQHTFNTEYRQGDFGLVLLPQNKRLSINLGYSLSRNGGDSVTTYNYSGDQYPLLSPIRAASNEYRVGADARLWIFDLSFEQGWRFFKEDTTYSVATPQAGNNTTNLSSLTTFSRDVPVRGTTPFTRLSLHTLLGKRLDVTGRYIYSGGETVVTLIETATGKDSSGNNIVLDTFNASGKAKRPYVVGDVGATWAVTDRLRISDTIRVNDFRINGAETLRELRLGSRTTPAGDTPLPPVAIGTDFGRTKDYRRFVNQFEVDYDFHQRFSAHVGHRYTDRHIVLSEISRAPGDTATLPETHTFDNRTNAYIFGLRARPLRSWSVFFDMERGKADSVFTRVENNDFTSVRVRSILRPTRTLAINTSFVTRNNSNTPPRDDTGNLLDVNIATRVFTSSIDWTPDAKFYLSSGYTHSRVTGDTGVLFFLANNALVNGRSRYYSRDNFAFVTAFVELHPLVRVYAGYRINKDDGQGDRISTSPTLLIGSYPLQFQSPEARISVKLHDRADWIIGYQYFDFKERFGNRQFYQAHLPYSSLRFYFGRRE